MRSRLYISYNLTFTKSRWAPRDRKEWSEGLKKRMTLKKVCCWAASTSSSQLGGRIYRRLEAARSLWSACVEVFFSADEHHIVVAETGVHHSFVAGAIAVWRSGRSWDQKYFLVSRWLGCVGFNGKYVERDLHLWMVFIFLSIKQPTHCVTKHHTVSMTDTTSLLSYVITQNQNMSRRISCSTPAELSVKLIIHKFTGMWSRRDLAARYCANTQKLKYTNAQIHKYTNTQIQVLTCHRLGGDLGVTLLPGIVLYPRGSLLQVALEILFHLAPLLLFYIFGFLLWIG